MSKSQIMKAKGKFGPRKAGTKTVTRSAKAGLMFPVGRISRLMRSGRYA